MFGIRSGADLNSPGILFDLNPSADFSSVFSPLLSFLNDCAAGAINHTAHPTLVQLTLSTCKKSLILQFLACMRETIRSRSGRPLASAVNSSSNPGSFIRSSTASSLRTISQRSRMSRNGTVPCVNILGFAEGHAEPDSEQTLPYHTTIRPTSLTRANSRTRWCHAPSQQPQQSPVLGPVAVDEDLREG